MRKQDRINRDHEQHQPEHQTAQERRPEDREQIKGSTSSPQPSKPHPSGKLPLPE